MQALRCDPSVTKLVLQFLEDLDSPISLKVYHLIVTGQWEELTELRFNPHQYLPEDWRKAKADYQAIEILRKADFLPLARDLETEARKTWFANEQQCFLTNARLSPFQTPSSPDELSVRVLSRVRRIKRRIGKLLGRVPDQIEPMFGPGSIYESAGVVPPNELVLLDKLDRIQPHVTPEAADIFHHYFYSSKWSQCSDRWSRAVPTLANRFATVPKDATRRRAIAVEPGGNLWLQKGIAIYIRRRLQRLAGLLLPEGKSEVIHHRLAQRGSLDGSFVTIDLSNASDTISNGLVQLLLPDEWYDLLSALRVKFTLIDGKRVYLEKFSSMGNGFTFELETLIFYAIAQTVCEDSKVDGIVSVYGDDIIVPSGASDEVIAALRFFGFTPNPRKTFVQGYFRESCGGDFFHGHDITPARLEEDVNPLYPEDWISICNKLHRRWDRECRFDPAHKAWKIAHAQIPSRLRCCQSTPEYGDSAIHWKEPRLFFHKSRDPKKASFHSLLPKLVTREPVRARMDRHSPDAILCYALLGGDPEGPSNRQRSTNPIRVVLADSADKPLKIPREIPWLRAFKKLY